MRSPEIITGILVDPLKVDPWAATIAKIIMNIKRILSKSDERHYQFIQTVKWAQDSQSSKSQGPAHTFVTMIKLLGLDIDLNRESDSGNLATIWISDERYG